MRDEFPVYEDPRGRFYALTRFEDVRQASVDWATFSSAAKLENSYLKPSMAGMDPPQHGEMRAVISKGFTPSRVTRFEPRIREIARRLIDAFIDRGTCDVISEYAWLLPSMVMGELIGVPDDLVAECRELTDVNMRKTAPRQSAPAAARGYEIFAELLAERRRRPQDDLMSALLVADVDGRRLTEDELLGFCWLLLVGGNDTTTNLIGNGVEVLARHPDQRAEVVADPSLIPAAVEEIFRAEAPAQALSRATTRDAVLEHGVIPEGQRVLLLWGAANLDEREFPDPDRFDIHRSAGRHLALGYGPHFCLGAALARLEAKVAFEELFARLPSYELAAPPTRLVSITFYGYETLPIAF
jgi:cytochrome P450